MDATPPMHRGKMVDRISAEPPLANRVRADCSPLLRGRRCKRSSSSNSRGVLLAFAAVLPSSAAMSCLSGGMLPISGHTQPLPPQLCTPAQRCRRRHRAARCIVKIDDDEAELCRIDEGCIYFVTGNMMKEREVNAILSEVDMPFRVTHVDIDLPELQGDALEIARHKCREAANQVDSAVLVEDTSLCFTALNGMPGPYIKWFQMTLGNEGLYSLLAGHTDHSAYCQCILGFSAGPGAEPVLFVGRTPGSIVPPASTGGFAWDAIFVPEGHSAPFSSMAVGEKNRISHRARALRRFVDYLLQHQDAVIKAIENNGEGADLPSCRRSLHEYGGATRDAAPPPSV